MGIWNGRKEDKYTKNFFLPVVFHNLKSYDAHFVIKHFKKQYTARSRDQDNDDIYEQEEESVSCEDVRVSPLNGEKYLSFQVGNLRFIHSFQFLSTSLDNLVSLLLKSGRAKFTHTTKFLGDDDLVFAKGVYPYSYMTGPRKFAETQLPPIEAFHNILQDEPCTQENYDRAREIWAHYNTKTMRDYHDHYLLSDVLLLAEVFENFRNSIYEQHRLNPLHFITLPSLAWASALKYTNVRLDLITDPDMYLMVENSMRGGIATISHRHARANNPLVEGYDPSKPRSWLSYTDCNNLYGGAMCQPLPVGNFRFPDEIAGCERSYPRRHGVECDLKNPQNFNP